MSKRRLLLAKRKNHLAHFSLPQQQSDRNYSLQEIQKLYGVPIRKTAYLIRSGVLEASLIEGTIAVSHQALQNYIEQPQALIKKHHTSYLKTLGPGLITGASDDDPSGIGTYTAVGASYGLGLSWLALYLLPMMVAVQETVARIGIVTERGLAANIVRVYGKKVLAPLVLLLVVANTINIGADLGAMVAALQLLFPVEFIPTLVVLTLGITLLETFVPYHRYAKILKWLALSLLAYLVTAIIIKPDWLQVTQSVVVPTIEFNAAFIAAMVAVMGTTITPYLFFWQASEEVEQVEDRGMSNDFKTTTLVTELNEMHKDTYSGMSIANVVFLSIVITAAFVFHSNGITDVATAATAAEALKPLAGDFASILFTVGILGVGLLAVPVMAGASAYAVSELFGWKESLKKSPLKAPAFYLVIVLSLVAGLLLNLIGIDPIKALYYAAILNGIVAPIIMIFIFRIGMNPKVVGPFTGSLPIRIFGWIATAFMGISAVALIVMLALGL